MNDYNFVGPFKEIAPLYIEYKKSLGYDCKSELAELKKMGYEDIYIHNIKTHKSESNFRPYIYSQKEIEMIFKYLDNNQYDNSQSTNNCVLPIFIRVLLGCGLRKNEAINLKNGDVDLEKRILIINNGKGNVTRLVPISESLASACKVYKAKFPKNVEYFFCNYKGQKLSRHITEHFQKALKVLNILRPDGTPPRLHDLRFTFAVMALEKMDKAGQDLYTTLPILCKYLGHNSIEATEHYVILVKDYFINVTNKEEQYYRGTGLFEEGDNNEK